ncbi:MAG: cobyrinate a,c-diamide synthase [Methanoregula sp.]|nr:cobyrinate a,c-diamide synthase [Methanoregula sp.]
MTSIPRIIIAGTHSGCGKTTIASGIMAALTARGLKVQPFKVGPDFIDPSHHTRICGRPSRNLDPFMMGEEGCVETFLRSANGADIAVIEGVMGMYDGVDGSDFASTAHVARILQAPVVLVVDAKGMSRSVHALVDGYRRYDPSITFSGVIFNRIGSPRHRSMVESSLNTPAIGWIPREEKLVVKSRHLGLMMAHESGAMADFGKVIEENADLDVLIASASLAPPFRTGLGLDNTGHCVRASVGVAFDDAFCFYYQDNLDLLRRAGAELVFFSPLTSPLPEVDAVYLGGGYPELHLPGLSSSRCRQDLKEAADFGMPVFAECGGLLYLAREIASDKTYPMCNILPATAEMTGQIQALGYVKGESVRSDSFLPAGLQISGHEFHYSRLDPARDARFALRLSRGKGIDAGKDGMTSRNAVGSYTHVYFTPAFASAFVDAAEKYSNR